MINKQNLWFITLFSLILILGIYYVTLPNTTITTLSETNENIESTMSEDSSDIIIAMKVEEEEKILEEMNNAQKILLDVGTTAEEKNDAYKTLQELNSKKGKVLELEKLLKDKYSLNSCIKISGNNINVIISSDDLGEKTANEIIKTIQEKYDTQMYITVKFQK